MSKRIFTILGIFAAVVLGGAAVWMGSLNQDEGWYLYAANLVAEGQVPYADFAYTQGPVMPVVYSVFAGIWRKWGLLGARVFTLTLGFLGILFAALTARRLIGVAYSVKGRSRDIGRGDGQSAIVKGRSRDEVDAKSVGDRSILAALLVFLLLGNNLYHLYYLAIPKTYALATLFVTLGFYLLTFLRDGRAGVRIACAVLSGASLALAAGTRISLGAILAVVGVGLLVDAASSPRRNKDGSIHIGRGGDAASTGASRLSFLWFALGGGAVLALVYGSLLLCPATRDGFLAAQKYHAARGGFDPVFSVGSLSRLVRWYLPIFILLGLGVVGKMQARNGTSGTSGTNGTAFAPDLRLILVSFLAVFAVQMLAPFPYEDYQVPVMALLAIYAAVKVAAAETRDAPGQETRDERREPGEDERREPGEDARPEPGESGSRETALVSCLSSLALGSCVSSSRVLSGSPLLLPLLALGLTWASSFGSPLLEKWMTNGQDRFWSIKKAATELAQLRTVARRIEALDPGGKDLLTQDLYLAIEMNRKVPRGLEMGPFSILSDEAWRKLLASAPCRVAALSGYSFAVNPPVCDERPLRDQMDYWGLLKSRYELSFQEESFGQNATTLLVLKRKKQ